MSAHSLQVKRPLSLSCTVSAKTCACQGSEKTGGSGRFKVRLPEVEGDAVAGGGVRPPELAGGEAHRVKMLWVFAPEVGVGIGEDMRPMVEDDLAQVAAGIGRQPGVAAG